MTDRDEPAGLDQIFDGGAERVLRAARARGDALPPGPTATTLGLLALHPDVRTRGGLPEINPELARDILTGHLPSLAAPARDDLSVAPRVLKALADARVDARLLSARKGSKVHAAIDEAIPAYEAALFDPERATWERTYARLMRDDGVDVTDEAAVLAWLGRYRERPLAERQAAFLTAAGDTAPAPGPRSTATVAEAEAAEERAAAADEHASTVRWAIEDSLRLHYLERPTSPAILAELRRRAYDERVSAHSDRLIDGVTAVGLSAALRGDFSDLAPAHSVRLRRVVEEFQEYAEAYDGCLPPVFGLAVPVPGGEVPGGEVPSGEVPSEAVRSAPVLVAAAELARWVAERGEVSREAFERHRRATATELGVPADVMEMINHVASELSFLRKHKDTVTAGIGWATWLGGDADDLCYLALAAYATVRLTIVDTAIFLRADDDVTPDDSWDLDAEDDGDFRDELEDRDRDEEFTEFESDDVHLFLELTSPERTVSITRFAAGRLDWMLPRAETPSPLVPAAEAEPLGPCLARVLRGADRDEDPTAPERYVLPPDEELQRLVGGDEPLGDDERAALARQASLTTFIADRMAAVGLAIRAGDTVTLLPLGEWVFRQLARRAGWDAPAVAAVATAEPSLMAMRLAWPRWAQLAGVAQWAAGNHGEGWPELLQAAVEAGPGSYQALFRLLGVDNDQWAGDRLGRAAGRGAPASRGEERLPVPLPDAVAEQRLLDALRDAVADPTIGAYALAAWRLRGDQAADLSPAAQPSVPPRARAILLRDRFASLHFAGLALDFANWRDNRDDRDDRDNRDNRDDRDDKETGLEPATGAVEPAGARDDAPLARVLVAAFDEEAEHWPGGASELLSALRDVPARPYLPVTSSLAIIVRARPAAAVAAARPETEVTSAPGQDAGAENAPARPRTSPPARVPSRRDLARRERPKKTARRKG